MEAHSHAHICRASASQFFNFGARFGMLAPERGPGEDLARTAAEDEREIVQKSKEELAREAAEAAAQAAAEAKERRIASLDLFALCAELGQKGQQFDVESDAMVETFVRGEDCLECIRQIFRCAEFVCVCEALAFTRLAYSQGSAKDDARE